MLRITSLINFGMILCFITGCNSINSPDDYFKTTLADASGCEKESINIVAERYEYPSSIWTISCGNKKFECYEQSSGFRQVSGYVSRSMSCDQV